MRRVAYRHLTLMFFDRLTANLPARLVAEQEGED